MNRLELLEGPGVECVYLEQERPCDEIGITDLYIQTGRDGFFLYDAFARALRQHQNTLGRFKFTVFNYVGEQENDDHLQDIYTIEYRWLKKLDLSVLGGWIPRNAPILEELKMTANTIREHMAVLDTIPPKLKTLELHLDDHFGPRHTASLERYLQRFPRHCQLKELVIHFASLINITSVLNAIHGLDQLQRLMISFTAQWDHHQMQRFIDGLVKGCPKLACLEIKCFNAPSTHSMNALKQLKYLERLAFSIKGMDGDDGF
ncbi:hypothetical protein O0I10_006635 [Lichtheimia ornata]|uniref:F-box domain-containing protein n=1 Tax=Lichtheimia ornata TaxID=688661 RepID=A0AAD7V2Z3_9FUNG|nr:uncharacterized protein O0I10_006635 [Lichtheimia ornata]KAJ8657571.1 hypothetical protein O0I10_006635 [Lichtheimia ornata]